MSSDVESITNTCLDYLEGWYGGDAGRVERALHPDLAKRGYHIVPATGRVNLVHVGAANMVEYTRAGLGKQNSVGDLELRVIILDIRKNTASAVGESIKYIDHIQLARIEDGWRIVNVLWEPKEG